jgi:ferritin-like metal-binding protein YciE
VSRQFRQSRNVTQNYALAGTLYRSNPGTTAMNDTVRALFITGLKNAHAMENQAQEILERQVERMGKYPEVRTKLREHLRETKEQLKRLEKCLEDLDSSPSSIKDTIMAFGSNIAAMGHAMAGDEALKNAFASNAFENYEIAAYKSLIVMAEKAGIRMKTILQESLREEERMADWLAKNVEKITVEYIQKEEKAAA